eukprot:TRINITY_DN10726_c0_g1_i13.p1 TRINITY_DN10726_c0_g1~~TRINITY_DN10726_c0_g1_i13.p1  ORF type:complete len:422 (-),score=112.58 TRINITY_DN10726_c0_g1_i13:14-1279(-)
MCIRDSTELIRPHKIKVFYNPSGLGQEKSAEECLNLINHAGLNIETTLEATEGDPAIVLKTSAGDVKVPCSKLPALAEFVKHKTSVKRAKTLFDVVEYLKEVNKGLFDSTVVCYFTDEQWSHFLSKPNNRKALQRLLRQSKGVVRVASRKTAKKMRLRQKKFYKYYKPSFANGYGNVINLNVEYWQAVTGECRNPLVKGEDGFKEEQHVEFYFHKSWKNLPRDDRPLVCVYWDKNAVIWPLAEQITKLACKYSSDCDFVFTTNKQKLSARFHMGEVEENLPYLFVADPVKRLPIISPFTKQQVGSYPAVYSDVALLMFGVDDASKFLDKYFEGKLSDALQSKRMARPTLVKVLNKESFEEMLKDESVEQCVMQVYKHNCASCYFNAKSFDALAWKLQKYGLWGKLRLYKLRADNELSLIHI